MGNESNLLPGWCAPDAPAKYPDLTAVRLVERFGHRWHLDFSRVDAAMPVGRFFASDIDRCPKIAWPWVDGVALSDACWAGIGFVVVEVQDESNVIDPSAAAKRLLANETLFDLETTRRGGYHAPGNA
jgi:hypothetical protein